MQLFDSVKKEKVPFEPMDSAHVKLYVCGPTVYDDAHLGHARSALSFDLLRRTLQAEGFGVIFVRNVTDVDDKIVKKAAQNQQSETELTTHYLNAYHQEMELLGVKAPDIEPFATQHLDAMFTLIRTLLEKGFAYKVQNGDIYFDSSKDANYLSLSKRSLENTQSRIGSEEQKRSESDFALWKTYSDGSKTFESPFGEGRPGWHLECSAMIQEHLAAPETPYAIDIHGGGADLLFPHHENEAAQSRCAYNQELAKYWIHNGFVRINNEKMSKSLGNSFFLKDALKLFNPEALRYYLLSVHYRSDFNYSETDLEIAKKRLDKLYRLLKRTFGLSSKLSTSMFKKALLEVLSDDLNTSAAYALVDEFINEANDFFDNDVKDKAKKNEIVFNVTVIQEILGFGCQNPYEYFLFGVDETQKAYIESLIIQRNEAKKEKAYDKADAIRQELTALGAKIMDTPNGTYWEKL